MHPQPLADFLESLPNAKQFAAVRAARKQLINLIREAELAVGYPKEDGRWSPVLAYAVREVSDRIHERMDQETQKITVEVKK